MLETPLLKKHSYWRKRENEEVLKCNPCIGAMPILSQLREPLPNLLWKAESRLFKMPMKKQYSSIGETLISQMSQPRKRLRKMMPMDKNYLKNWQVILHIRSQDLLKMKMPVLLQLRSNLRILTWGQLFRSGLEMYLQKLLDMHFFPKTSSQVKKSSVQCIWTV